MVWVIYIYTYSTCLNKLRILQKKAIRIITQSHYLAHTDPLFSKLKLLKLDDLYKHQFGIYMYKSTKGLLPDSMSSMVIPIHNVHDHHLRNQNGYHIQHVRTNCRQFTIHYTVPVFWNTLPEQLREAVSENQFKRKLKDFKRFRGLMFGQVTTSCCTGDNPTPSCLFTQISPWCGIINRL